MKLLSSRSRPLFSIVIPVYRDIDRLNSCLQRFSSIPFTDYEVIVVNNDLEKSALGIDYSDFLFPVIELWEPKSGSYAARNTGIAHAHGDVIAFIDSDCLPDVQWLETARDLFNKDFKRELGILTGPVTLFYKDPLHLTAAELYEKHTGGFTTASYARDGHAITANWFSYKSVLLEFGGFDASLKSNGDTELSGKISQRYSIYYCPDLIVYHPARNQTADLVHKYQRLLGGVYNRRYMGDPGAFRRHVILFLWARYRFALKRLLTIPLRESFPILGVCHQINRGIVAEYYRLLQGEEPKR